MLFTQGDVAGIGPEILARAWPSLLEFSLPVAVGDIVWMNKALKLVGSQAVAVESVLPGDVLPSETRVPCIAAATVPLNEVAPGKVDAAAGRAAYDFLVRAIDLTMAGKADAVVTCPLHKEGLHLAGLNFPGHTEILAQRTGAKEHVMILALEELAVAHVTLHLPLSQVFQELSIPRIAARARLLHDLLAGVLGRAPRLAAAALNPHGSDGGIFGNEEAELIAPAVKLCQNQGLNIVGPIPADTLFLRASQGEFDGVVAMYHDQGHIALKLLGQRRAVNITAGLPIIRTSVAHGTAYDIAWQGKADGNSLLTAARWAVRLGKSQFGLLD